MLLYNFKGRNRHFALEMGNTDQERALDVS